MMSHYEGKRKEYKEYHDIVAKRKALEEKREEIQGEIGELEKKITENLNTIQFLQEEIEKTKNIVTLEKKKGITDDINLIKVRQEKLKVTQEEFHTKGGRSKKKLLNEQDVKFFFETEPLTNFLIEISEKGSIDLNDYLVKYFPSDFIKNFTQKQESITFKYIISILEKIINFNSINIIILNSDNNLGFLYHSMTGIQNNSIQVNKLKEENKKIEEEFRNKRANFDKIQAEFDETERELNLLEKEIKVDRYHLGRFGAIAEALSPDKKKEIDDQIKAFNKASKEVDEAIQINNNKDGNKKEKLEELRKSKEQALAQLNITLTSLEKLTACTKGPEREYNPRKFRQFLGEVFAELGELLTVTADKSLAREIEKIKKNIPDENSKISVAKASGILKSILNLLPNIYNAVTSYLNDMSIGLKASYHQVEGYEDTFVAKASRGFKPKKPKG